MSTVFVYSKRPAIRMISNYMDKIESQYFFKNSNKFRDEDYLMMIRSHHVCRQAI
jgi:hypothetical protein